LRIGKQSKGGGAVTLGPRRAGVAYR